MRKFGCRYWSVQSLTIGISERSLDSSDQRRQPLEVFDWGEIKSFRHKWLGGLIEALWTPPKKRPMQRTPKSSLSVTKPELPKREESNQAWLPSQNSHRLPRRKPDNAKLRMQAISVHSSNSTAPTSTAFKIKTQLQERRSCRVQVAHFHRQRLYPKHRRASFGLPFTTHQRRNTKYRLGQQQDRRTASQIADYYRQRCHR